MTSTQPSITQAAALRIDDLHIAFAQAAASTRVLDGRTFQPGTLREFRLALSERATQERVEVRGDLEILRFTSEIPVQVSAAGATVPIGAVACAR